MSDTIRVRNHRFNWRIRSARLMYCHKIGNDLRLFSDDGRFGELKKCSLAKFCRHMPKDILKAFVEVNNGHFVNEQLIAGYDRDQLRYEQDIFKRLHKHAHEPLNNLSPSERGYEDLEKRDISF